MLREIFPLIVRVMVSSFTTFSFVSVGFPFLKFIASISSIFIISPWYNIFYISTFLKIDVF